ncbi:SRPBCC family protein [Streptomyces albiflavescens]|uniref:SRPBCC family protein n=1 Tax=Streptomyces albiflavescens TaxID=1623582 RepID=UPI003570F1E1
MGAIRALHLPGARVREEVTEYHRPARSAYRMLSGAPLRHFTASVTFTAVGQGRTEVCTGSTSSQRCVPSGRSWAESLGRPSPASRTQP